MHERVKMLVSLLPLTCTATPVRIALYSPLNYM